MEKKPSARSSSGEPDTGVPIHVKLLLGVLVFAVIALTVKIYFSF